MTFEVYVIEIERKAIVCQVFQVQVLVRYNDFP